MQFIIRILIDNNDKHNWFWCFYFHLKFIQDIVWNLCKILKVNLYSACIISRSIINLMKTVNSYVNLISLFFCDIFYKIWIFSFAFPFFFLTRKLNIFSFFHDFSTVYCFINYVNYTMPLMKNTLKCHKKHFDQPNSIFIFLF